MDKNHAVYLICAQKVRTNELNMFPLPNNGDQRNHGQQRSVGPPQVILFEENELSHTQQNHMRQNNNASNNDSEDRRNISAAEIEYDVELDLLEPLDYRKDWTNEMKARYATYLKKLQFDPEPISDSRSRHSKTTHKDDSMRTVNSCMDKQMSSSSFK